MYNSKQLKCIMLKFGISNKWFGFQDIVIYLTIMDAIDYWGTI